MTASRAPSILAIVAALVLVASSVVVARAIAARTAVRTLTGQVTWVDTARAQFDRDVHGGWVYPTDRLPSPADCIEAMYAVALVPGQTINVYDTSGSVVARGSLGSASAPVSNTSSTGDRSCAVSFTVSGVPRATDYVVEVGANRAMYPSYALEAKGWDIELPLGPG
jgi:hypothetical protein